MADSRQLRRCAIKAVPGRTRTNHRGWRVALSTSRPLGGGGSVSGLRPGVTTSGFSALARARVVLADPLGRRDEQVQVVAGGRPGRTPGRVVELGPLARALGGQGDPDPPVLQDGVDQGARTRVGRVRDGAGQRLAGGQQVDEGRGVGAEAVGQTGGAQPDREPLDPGQPEGPGEEVGGAAVLGPARVQQVQGDRSARQRAGSAASVAIPPLLRARLQIRRAYVTGPCRSPLTGGVRPGRRRARGRRRPSARSGRPRPAARASLGACAG